MKKEQSNNSCYFYREHQYQLMHRFVSVKWSPFFCQLLRQAERLRKSSGEAVASIQFIALMFIFDGAVTVGREIAFGLWKN